MFMTVVADLFIYFLLFQAILQLEQLNIGLSMSQDKITNNDNNNYYIRTYIQI